MNGSMGVVGFCALARAMTTVYECDYRLSNGLVRATFRMQNEFRPVWAEPVVCEHD